MTITAGTTPDAGPFGVAVPEAPLEDRKLPLRARLRRLARPQILVGGTVVLLWLLCSVPLISWFAVPALVVDHVWAARDPQRQTIHDKLAGTEVVQR